MSNRAGVFQQWSEIEEVNFRGNIMGKVVAKEGNGDGNARSNYQTRRGETPRKLKMKHSAMRENLQSL